MRPSLYDFCAGHEQALLLAQWDDERNAPLTPKDVTYGSHQRYGGDAPKAIPTVPKSESARGERAVPSALAASFCRRKTLWRQNFLICFRSGTRKRILRCCRRRSCREHIGRSGGGVRKDIAGRRALPAALHQTQAVRSARDKRSCLDSMISLRCIRSLLNSGIGKRTVR